QKHSWRILALEPYRLGARNNSSSRESPPLPHSPLYVPRAPDRSEDGDRKNRERQLPHRELVPRNRRIDLPAPAIDAACEIQRTEPAGPKPLHRDTTAGAMVTVNDEVERPVQSVDSLFEIAHGHELRLPDAAYRPFRRLANVAK